MGLYNIQYTVYKVLLLTMVRVSEGLRAFVKVVTPIRILI